LWLCCNDDNEKNAIMCSMQHAPDVFNGDDSVKFLLGDESAILAGCNLYSRLGSTIYSITLLFKAREVWGLSGNTADDFSLHQISEKIGCVAPLTLDTTIISIEGASKPVAIWQGVDGIYLFDNNSIIPIHGDIRDRFDRKVETRIDRDMIGESRGFFDHENHEYHWCYAQEGSSILDKELVYDLRRQRWFEVYRGIDRQLTCGFTVVDTLYNTYNYGAIAGGYLERLEYGTTFDGADIEHEFQTGDIALHEGLSTFETKIRHIKLTAVSKTETTDKIIMYHYGDTNEEDTNFTIDPKKVGHRVIEYVKSHDLGANVFHSFRATISTRDETVGFEPLAISGFYKLIREDTRGG